MNYVYATTFTYVAFRLTRNVRQMYIRSALSQEVGFFDQGTAGSISMQATSNGKTIQLGISDKLGVFFQSIATFVAAFILAFVTHWKLTLIIICIVPAVIVVVGVVASFLMKVEAEGMRVLAQAGTYAESTLGNVRAIKAFNLESRIIRNYCSYLDDARRLGNKKNGIFGILFGWQYFVIYAGMGLAFWQGIELTARGETDGIATVFT